MSNKQFNKV